MSPFLQDLWDEAQAAQWKDDPLELLRYRSNLLGADLRITNFGGGNTSSKFECPDPFTGRPVQVLAVKGSGGDLGSIKKEGFALLYMDRILQLQSMYRGEAHEDEMVAYYPLAAYGTSRVAASIDTPLHAFLPFPHVDHLHPDWAIALAASANGKARMQEFNKRFGSHLAWVPWQRPGFELALMLKRAVESTPGCDGIVLGGHGLFSWGNTSQECYQKSLTLIGRLGEFIGDHRQKLGKRLFGGQGFVTRTDAADIVAAIFPYLRGRVGARRRVIGHYNDSDDVLQFVNSRNAEPLANLGTSCPDHFIRTKICPLLVDWNPGSDDLERLRAAISKGIETYRAEYEDYYRSCARPDSPALRDSSPAVVLIPGVGMFTFGKDKKEARIIGEFYVNAIHVMAGATALGDGAAAPDMLPQAKRPEDSALFKSHFNYVALPRSEAFKIEYWALEEAKLRRMPPEKEFSRKIYLVAGGGSGVGLVTAARLVELGAHVMVADINAEAAAKAAALAAGGGSQENVSSSTIDLGSRASIGQALRKTVLKFGGLDGIINTAAVFFPPGRDGRLNNEAWHQTLGVNVTGNYFLIDEARSIFADQALKATVVLTSSANAVVPKQGSEAYDISKSAVNHLIRELAIGLAPLVRVNGIAPATVVEGSSMFPRERVISSLLKYGISFQADESTEALRGRLAEFYARRTLTGLSITPDHCAEAICWLAGERSGRTTGHIIPVDGGLVEAFLR